MRSKRIVPWGLVGFFLMSLGAQATSFHSSPAASSPLLRAFESTEVKDSVDELLSGGLTPYLKTGKL